MQFMDAMLSSSSKSMMAILELFSALSTKRLLIELKSWPRSCRFFGSFILFLLFVCDEEGAPGAGDCVLVANSERCSREIVLFFQPLKLSFEADQSRQLVHSIHDVVFQSSTQQIESALGFKLKEISR